MEKTAVFQLRITAATLRRWKTYAKKEGTTVSEWLRQLAEGLDSPKAATARKAKPAKRDSGRVPAKG